MTYGEPVECAEPGCAAKHPGGKWGNIRAHSDGWFESRDGKSYCPKHVPKWVKKWRKK
jgi:hypothetical protein